MSIEKNFDRIATALERIASVLEKKPATVEVVSQPMQDVALPPAASVVPPPIAAVPPPVPATLTPPPPADQTVEPSAKEVNDILMIEAARLGGGTKIFELMQAQFGTRSVTSIPSAQYTTLIAAVKALV